MGAAVFDYVLSCWFAVPRLGRSTILEASEADEGCLFRTHMQYKALLRKEDTRFHQAVPSEKRLAMTLHFLAHGLPYPQLALLYSIGKSTALHIVHETISVLNDNLLKNSIRFPDGEEQQHVLVDFEQLAGLPQREGGIDGTFMPIKKPVLHGDSYWCYKGYIAILLLAVVDAHGFFTYITLVFQVQ